MHLRLIWNPRLRVGQGLRNIFLLGRKVFTEFARHFVLVTIEHYTPGWEGIR